MIRKLQIPSYGDFHKINFVLALLAFFCTLSNAQDSLNVTWVASCLGSNSYNVTHDEINNNSYIFISQNGSIMMLDISNPTNPHKVIEIGHPGSTGRGVVVDTLFYFTTGHYGLWIYNVANASVPCLLGICKTDNARSVAVAGNYAFVANGNNGLVIIDISEPSMPVQVSTLYLQAPAVDIVIVDTLAYIAALGKLVIVNVADAYAPVVVGSWNPHGPFDYVRSVQVQSDFAYVANFDLGLWVIDISNPQTPISIDSITFGLAMDVDINGNYAYCAAEDNGVVIINITDPYNIFIEGMLDTPGSAHGICYFGYHVSVADVFSTRIIDVTDAANPIEVGVYNNLTYFAQDVAISGNFAYVAYGEDGLRIVDISNPYFPQEVGFVDTPDNARGIAVLGNYAYIADFNSGLRIIDVTNPSNPYEIGYCDTIGCADAIAVSDNYAYVGCAGELNIINISNPYLPYLEYPVQTDDYAYCVVKDGNYVYFCWGVSIIDVSNHHVPHIVSEFSLSDGFGIAVKDNYLYTSDPFCVVDVSNHSTPMLLDSLRIPGVLQNEGLAVEGNYAYIGYNYRYPVYVVDISNPFDVEIAGFYDTGLQAGGGPSYRLKVLDYYIYVVSDDRGLHVFRFTGAPGITECDKNILSTIRLEVLPNPFSVMTQIRWHYPHSNNQITIAIFDVAGRLVKTYHNPTDILLWNGKDDFKRDLSAGIYFIQLKTAHEREIKKVIKVNQ